MASIGTLSPTQIVTASPVERPVNPPATGKSRDLFVDGLRAMSLFVVVAWHWIFTVISWNNGPHTGNPIGSTPGLWVLTWILQVMPLFFWVGGFAHLQTWQSIERSNGTNWSANYKMFCRRRLGRLLRPAAMCVGLALVARLIAGAMFPDTTWLTSGLMVMLSPLWFLAVYIGLVCLAPVAIVAHRRLGELMLVLLAGAACAVDVARFHYHVPYVAWLNFLFVWAFAHQLGFFYERLVNASRRIGLSLAIGGLIGLIGLTNMHLYPGSMVGVPGQAFSNMGPPTLCILALSVFQAGAAVVIRPAVLRWLARPRARRLTDWAAEKSMTVYLWHFVGFSVAYGLLSFAGLQAPQTSNALWWLERPLYIAVPALITAPLIGIFGRVDRARRSTSASPVLAVQS